MPVLAGLIVGRSLVAFGRPPAGAYPLRGRADSSASPPQEFHVDCNRLTNNDLRRKKSCNHGVGSLAMTIRHPQSGRARLRSLGVVAVVRQGTSHALRAPLRAFRPGYAPV